jgi:NAD(P) transhydrogenase subunit beta
MSHSGFIIAMSDFIAAFLLIYGIKRMSSPITAQSGIVVAGYGMWLAVLASFLYMTSVRAEIRPHLVNNCVLALVALAVGAGWAWRSGKTVAITGMPQMVAIYNGLGGGAAAAIAATQLYAGQRVDLVTTLVTLAGALIGCVSLSGSIIAWGKLDDRIRKPWRIRGQQIVNGVVIVGTIALAAVPVFVLHTGPSYLLVSLFLCAALICGVLITMPIGGADMPVVISLFNACTGLAVSLDGYVLQNTALMIAGMVVGAAGWLLTQLMAKAMNRSVRNILLSHFGEEAGTAQGAIKGQLKPVEASDAATTMRYASSVIIVPGYGLAVAQAQGKLYEFVKLLQAAGVAANFAIHPVAGRMPGHMNVLLAEAGAPYDLLHDLDEINDEFKATDVVLVVGANDIVNPVARTDKHSSIYGMPILNVDKAHQIFVIKRGTGTGYSGIENVLFFADNCNMVYGDAKAVLSRMVETIRLLETKEAA